MKHLTQGCMNVRYMYVWVCTDDETCMYNAYETMCIEYVYIYLYVYIVY